MAFKRKGRKKGVKLIKSKPSTVDGIKFKSQLEVYAYKELQKAKIKFKYEEDKFSLIDGFPPISESWEFRYKKFAPVQNAIRGITYTPDFTCPDMQWVIETKGRPTILFLPTNKSQVDICVEQILKL